MADPSSVTVVITGDYFATLRVRSERYRTSDVDTDPWMPGSGALTFMADSGQPTIALRQALWEIEGVEPLIWVAHEALHVATRQRGELMYGLSDRLPDVDEATRNFAGYAGIAIEEYRVDRALCSQSEWSSRTLRHTFDDDLVAFAKQCATAWQREQRDGDGDAQSLLSTVQTAFMQMIYTAAGVCAVDLCSDGQAGPKRTEPAWSRLVGPHYDVLRTHLSRIPDATEPRAADRLQTEAVALVPPLLRWAAQFGWTVEPGSRPAHSAPTGSSTRRPTS